MNKNILFSLVFILFLENSCKEQSTLVDLTPATGKNFDSSYILSAAAIAALTTDPHHVLIEEFTGQMCVNCPSARDFLTSQAAAYPNLIHIIGIYPYDFPQANPTPESVYDFRDSIGTVIGNTIYRGIMGLPSGGVDRKQENGTIISSRGLWAGNISSQITIADSLNLSLKCSFDMTTMVAKIIATITYTQPVIIKHNLTVVLIEGDIKDAQEFPDGLHKDYNFTHVFRDMISSVPYGDAILDSIAIKEKGRVFQRTFYYKLKTKSPVIKPENCDVIAFINNTESGKLNIVQSAEAKFAP